MISATQMRPGMVIKYNNELYSVFSVSHRTPGNLRGFVQAKMRSLRTGSMTENRFSSEDRVEKAMLEEHEMERSEERRVGKECRTRWRRERQKTKNNGQDT